MDPRVTGFSLVAVFLLSCGGNGGSPKDASGPDADAKDVVATDSEAPKADVHDSALEDVAMDALEDVSVDAQLADTGRRDAWAAVDAYDPCLRNCEAACFIGQCGSADLECYIGLGGSVCWPTCTVVSDCPVATTGTAEVECFFGQCHLHCPDGAACPDGMFCKADEDEGGPHCVWCADKPQPNGSSGISCPLEDSSCGRCI